MKMSTLLMATVLLLGAAAASLNFSLNVILDEIPKLNQTSTQGYFVEDLTHLTEGANKCGDAFFCKVQDILLHRNFSRSVEEEEEEEEKKLEKNLEEKKKPKKNAVMVNIMRNLKTYIDKRNVSCSQVLKDVKTSNVSTPAFKFWERIEFCIRHRNLHGHK